jgi:hypothetical protein
MVAPAGIDWRADLAYTAAFLRLKLPPEFQPISPASAIAKRPTFPHPRINKTPVLDLHPLKEPEDPAQRHALRWSRKGKGGPTCPSPSLPGS